MLHFRLTRCFPILIAAAAVGIRAQTVTPPAASTTSGNADDAVALSPFVVSGERDTGYIAADTLNAGPFGFAGSTTSMLSRPGDAAGLQVVFLGRVTLNF